ncbi:MAG: hypothetical protein IJH75_00065 [Mogibacterium sp.]|nr:hypothetical protein [Mogibacterium sp.]
MSDCLSFKECEEFIYHKGRVTPDYLRLASRVLEHIRGCEACNEMYRTMLEAHDAAEEILDHAENGLTVKEKVLRALRNYRNASEELLEGWSRKLDDPSLEFPLQIKSRREIAMEGYRGKMAFSHPVVAGTSKGYGGNVFRMDGEQMRSILIDEDFNRISIEMDGSLILRLDPKLAPEGGYAMLVSKDYDLVLIEEIEAGVDGMSQVYFEDVLPGEYVVVI